MALTSYQKISYKIFGKLAARSSQIEHIKIALEKVHKEIRPDAYVAYAWMNALVAAVVGIFLIIAYIWVLPSIGMSGPVKLLVVIIPSPLLLATIAYSITMMMPDLKISGRRKDIDNRLPYALNFIAAMASAGVTPASVFKSLAEQPIYGEVREEAKWIHRDISIFGMDIVTALREAARRSPSIKFQEFLQGAITTITSGGELKPYFLAKADQYMRENRRTQKDFLETLGVLAESYVTVVVSAPLFLIVMISVMSMVGGGGFGSSRMMLYMIAFIMLPISHLAFTFVIKSMTPEV